MLIVNGADGNNHVVHTLSDPPTTYCGASCMDAPRQVLDVRPPTGFSTALSGTPMHRRGAAVIVCAECFWSFQEGE
jgi:hypothetical protein